MSKFNFNIDIESNDKGNLSKSRYNSKTQKQIYNDTLFVDLNLPSGTLWSKYNLGVNPFESDTKENWYGDYYAWGELEPKDEYTIENYKFFTMDNNIRVVQKYMNNEQRSGRKADSISQLELVDDVAYQTYEAYIPNTQMIDELNDNTSFEWVNNYNDIKQLNGLLFTSDFNRNTLFIPAHGDSNNDSNNIVEFWTSIKSLSFDLDAYTFYYDGDRASDFVHITPFRRDIGRPIRYVKNKNLINV